MLSERHLEVDVQDREWRLPLLQVTMLGASLCLGLASLASSIYWHWSTKGHGEKERYRGGRWMGRP